MCKKLHVYVKNNIKRKVWGNLWFGSHWLNMIKHCWPNISKPQRPLNWFLTHQHFIMLKRIRDLLATVCKWKTCWLAAGLPPREEESAVSSSINTSRALTVVHSVIRNTASATFLNSFFHSWPLVKEQQQHEGLHESKLFFLLCEAALMTTLFSHHGKLSLKGSVPIP